MRVLKFVVDGQTIKKDEQCDFSNLVPGTEGYLKVEFSFSPEWHGYVKAARFFSSMGREYPQRMLKDGKSCVVPSEALGKKVFKIQVIGKNTNSKLTTNKVAVSQDGR